MGAVVSDEEEDPITEAREQGYLAGVRSANLNALRHVLSEMRCNGDDAEAKLHAWRLERGEIVALLRRVCAEHGDLEWEDDLHLVDVLDKHLFRHMEIDA